MKFRHINNISKSFPWKNSLIVVLVILLYLQALANNENEEVSFRYLYIFLLGLFIVYRLHKERQTEISEKISLRNIDKAKDRLFANVAHEINTPLNLISGPISIALEENRHLDSDEMELIFNQSQRLQQLTSKILDLQKIKSGNYNPNLTYGNVVPLISSVVENFKHAAAANGCDLHCILDPNPIYMDFDEEIIIQSLSNLITNAIKYTSGNGLIIIKVGIVDKYLEKKTLFYIKETTQKALQYSVEDNGIGIDSDILPQIFNRYYRIKDNDNIGTGIGLQLTWNLINVLNGDISVSSEKNKGSVFTIEIPIKQHYKKTIHYEHDLVSNTISIDPYADEDENYLTEELTIVKPVTNSDRERPKVLIIDDHEESAEFVRKCLSKDYLTIVRHSGEDGLKAAFKIIPDIVISDLVMPAKSGIDVVKKLNHDIRTSHIPIILLTGRNDEKSKIDGIESGADVFLTKPFNKKELLVRIKNLLDLRSKLYQHYYGISNHIDRHIDYSSAKENDFLKEIRSFVELNIDDNNMDLDSIASHLNMSTSNLNRKIKGLTAKSTWDFVLSIKFSVAANLLKQTSLRANEIGYNVGFTSPQYFSRSFKKYCGMTPMEFRTMFKVEN